MDGAYIGGQVCYLDHVTADYLSLLEFRKIGKYVGYDENDLFSGKVQIHYRVPGTFEEIVADSTIVTLIGKIPPNRFVEIFYVGPDASKEFGSQFFLEWPTLDDDEFNLDGFGETGINQETETDKEGLENFEVEPLFEHTGNISSDEANSEDFDSLDEGEDNIEEIEQVDLKNPQFRIGMMFANKKEAKEAMEHHSMRTGEVEPQAHYPPPPTNLLGEHNDTPQPQRLRKWFVEIACGKCGKLGHNKVGCGKSQHTNATNKNQETQQVNTQATNQNAQANSQTSGTQMSQGNTETRAPINSQGKKKQHVSSQAGQQGKGKQPVRRGGYKGMGNQARPWRL
ncbi:unnamed protein product [Malus baccata var. baccata]